MSSIYRIHGARFLRKYTAADRSSIYAYMSDVKTIANTLCKVPWTRVANDIPATTTIHTEEGLDWNEPERDRFDAAEWCGEHSNGFHRAFAQAACYVFKLPTSAIGKSIQKLGIQVTSDAYNPYGARIAAMTSATLNIPTDCDTVRQGEVFRAPDEDGMGAAPRLFMRNANGSQTWYSNTELVELTPQSALTAKQFLFVFVCLENYNRGRDGWIEGSSYIDNDIEMTLSAAASDLIENELNDLSPEADGYEMLITKDGIYKNVICKTSTVETLISMPNNENLANMRVDLYRKFFSSAEWSDYAQNAVKFDVGKYNQGETTTIAKYSINASVLCVPFVLPSFDVGKIKFAWDNQYPNCLNAFANVWLSKEWKNNDAELPLNNSGLFTGKVSTVNDFSLIGRIDFGLGLSQKIFDVGRISGQYASLLICAYFPPEFFVWNKNDDGLRLFKPDISIHA